MVAVAAPPKAAKAGPAGPQGQELFNEAFILLAVRKSRPSFTVKIPKKRKGSKDREVALQVDGRPVSEETEKSTETAVDLLPKEARNRLNAAYRRVDDYLLKSGITFPHPTIDSLRVLPAQAQEEFFGGWPAVERRFREDLEAFFAGYEADVVPHGSARLNELFGPEEAARAAGRHLPGLARLKGKFGVRVARCTLSYADAEDASSAVRDLAENLRDRLEDALAGVADRLAGGKVLSERTFTDLKSVLATAKAFGEVMGDDLVARAGEMEGRLAALSDEVAVMGGRTSMTDVVKKHRQVLESAISGMMDAVKDPEGVARVVSRFGAAPRAIRG